MARALIVAFRLGGTDGVSIEAAKWAWALEQLGFEVTTMAGAGAADVVLPELAIGADGPDRVVLPDADVVVVENLLSLAPLNPAAARAVAAALAGRHAVIRHHDLPWQQPRYAAWSEPVADDPCWRHVTINEVSRVALAERGIAATTIYNAFDADPPHGDRRATRDKLGLGGGDRLLLHPSRALPRKNVGAAIALAEALDATYWLLGDVEDPPELTAKPRAMARGSTVSSPDGYRDEFDALVAAARTRVVRDQPADIADAYAVCLPSTWEGFGNATVESATYRKPLAIGDYPVARELAAFGFRWFAADDAAPLDEWLSAPDEQPPLLDHNAAIARRHFDLADLPARLDKVLRG
ncbi:MAG: glycosyltransferase [Actinobacteria bacterium]|nr:glycosyltransferase [Actinomycetota bacterium]